MSYRHNIKKTDADSGNRGAATRSAIVCLALATFALALGCNGNTRSETTVVEEKATTLESAKTFMWRAEAPGQPGRVVHLVGSIHVGNASFYPLPAPIERAFNETNTLVVELDPTDQKKLAMALMRMGMLPEGETLQATMPPELWTKLADYAAAHSLPPLALQRFKPWVVALQLLTLQMIDIGLDPQMGLDAHFVARAQSAKSVVSLESAEFQMGIFDGLSPELQLLLLADAVEGLSQPDAGEMRTLADLWIQGDAQGVESLLTKYLVESPEFQPLFDELITARNVTMTKRIAQLAETHPSLFVVVGAGHLVGPQGIVERLRAQGWTIEQVLQS